MPTIKVTERINASPKVIWDVLNDFERMSDLVEFVDEVYDVSNDPIGEGTIYKERATMMGSTSISVWKIIRFVPYSLQIHEGSMTEMNALLTFEMEPSGEGTNYTQIMEFKAFPKFRPFGWIMERLVMKRVMKKEIEKVVRNLKKLSEAKIADERVV